MAGNGSKVDWRSLHAELLGQSKDRADMEQRLVETFASGVKVIRDDMAEERKVCDARFKCVEQDVVTLKVADRRWGGIVGLFAAGAAAVAGWLGTR